MAIYAIGDVQGCFDELQALLRVTGYRRGRDRLWFVGDLVNRGPRSLDVLRFVMDLGDEARTVLGNHDLNLLAVAAGVRDLRPKDTLDDILAAPDRDGLLAWIARQPLIVREADGPWVMVHAGLAPAWSVDDAEALAGEVSDALGSDRHAGFLAHMYGDRPDRWDPGLAGWKRLRFITNALTRIRYVDRKGRLDLAESGPPGSQRKGLFPWFAVPGRASTGHAIVFGHWATLQLDEPVDPSHDAHHLDTGCVWGGRLTAMRLEDGERFSVPCARPAG